MFDGEEGHMRALAGAVVVLAAAVLFAGGAVADSTVAAANRSGYAAGGTLSMVAGAGLGLLGLVLLIQG